MEPVSTGLPINTLLFVLVLLGIGVLGTTFWMWMLIECATKESNQGNTKIVWAIIIIFTHLIGALLYFLLRRPERRRETAG